MEDELRASPSFAGHCTHIWLRSMGGLVQVPSHATADLEGQKFLTRKFSHSTSKQTT